MATNGIDYANLRTLLDSLEIGALRYFLNKKGSQSDKFKFLMGKLRPIADELWAAEKGLSGDCPTGYFSCDGMCVPYPCPDVSNTAATTAMRSTATQKKKLKK